MIRDFYKSKYLPAIIFLLSIFLVYYKILLTSGNFVFEDLTFPISLEKFIDVYKFTWNDSSGWSTFDYIPRLIYNLPFIILGIIFNLDISLVTKLIILFTAFLSVSSFFIFLRYLLRDLRFNDNIVTVVPIYSSIIYAINIWTIIRTRHIFYLPTYAILPLILFILIRFNNTRKNYIKNSMIIGILISIFGISPHGIFWIMSIIIFWLAFVSFFPGFDYRYLLQNIRFILLTILFSLLLSSYFIMPIFVSSFNMAPPYVMSWEVFDMLSRNSNLDNVIRLLSDWWPQGSYAPEQSLLYYPWLIISFLFPILAFCPLIIKRNKYTLYFSMLAIIFILFSLGTKTYISKVFYDIFFSLIGQFNWIFRDPAKNLSVVVLSYSILIGIMVSEILTYFDKKKFVIIIFIFSISYAVFIFPTVNSYMFESYVPERIPQEYNSANSWIKNETDDFNVIWLSSWDYGKRINGRVGYSWSPYKSVSQQITVESSEKPSFDKGLIKNFNYYSIYLRYIISKNIDIKKYLSPLSIKYIIYGNDGFGGEEKGDQEIQALGAHMNKSIRYNFIHIFENYLFSPRVNIVNNIGILGGLDKFTTLNTIDSFSPINSSLMFLDQNIVKNKYEYINNTDILILEDNLNELILSSIDDKYIIRPFDKTTHYNPSNLWSKAGINDPLHGEWRPYIERRNIGNWDFDYGKGIVFTWSDSIIGENIKISEEDILDTFNFENNFGEWYINDKDVQNITLSNNTRSGRQSLQSTLTESSWGWKTIDSPLIPVRYKIPYRWKFYIKGEDSYEIHAKIMEYDIEGRLIDSEYITRIGTGTFNWKDVSIDYVLQNKKTAYMQLQIWHGHETNQPLPSKIWIDDAKVYNLSKYIKPVTLDMDLNIDEDDNYELFGRLFKNKDGGRINISIDGDTIKLINTENQLNKFVWEKISTLNLKKGKHKLTLINDDGFNAVNIFALIPEREYQEMNKNIEPLIKGKRLIHIFEAESDLYRINANISNKYGGEASNGEVLEFNDTSRAWRIISILRSDNYKIALKGNGSFDMKIDELKYNVSSNISDFAYIGPIYLAKGYHKIEITKYSNGATDSDLDVIWLYSINNTGEKLEDIFRIDNIPATVLNYTKMDPTLYKIKVNATKPFMVSFAESYDPLWTAKIDKIDGKSVKSGMIRPIPLYSVVNGFWINQTGNLDITVEYEPQGWFYIGATISITTLIICIAYFIFDWRKKKDVITKNK